MARCEILIEGKSFAYLIRSGTSLAGTSKSTNFPPYGSITRVTSFVANNLSFSFPKQEISPGHILPITASTNAKKDRLIDPVPGVLRFCADFH